MQNLKNIIYLLLAVSCIFGFLFVGFVADPPVSWNEIGLGRARFLTGFMFLLAFFGAIAVCVQMVMEINNSITRLKRGTTGQIRDTFTQVTRAHHDLNSLHRNMNRIVKSELEQFLSRNREALTSHPIPTIHDDSVEPEEAPEKSPFVLKHHEFELEEVQTIFEDSYKLGQSSDSDIDKDKAPNSESYH